MAVIDGQATKKPLDPYAILTPVAVGGWCWASICSIPQKYASHVFSGWQRWQNPNKPTLFRTGIFGVLIHWSSTYFFLFFFPAFQDNQTIHSNNKKQITTWFILTIAVTGTKRGTKRKRFQMKRRRSGSKNSILFPCPPSLLLPLIPTATLQSENKKGRKKKGGGENKGWGCGKGKYRGKNSQITIGNCQNRLFSLVVFIPFVFRFSFSLLSPFFVGLFFIFIVIYLPVVVAFFILLDLERKNKEGLKKVRFGTGPFPMWQYPAAFDNRKKVLEAS